MIVETQGLTRSFGRRTVLEDVNLSLPEGAAMALLGANGAGKTTLLRLLVNLLRPSKGHAQVLGMDSRRLAHPAYRRIGYVSESQALPGRLTIGQYFDYLPTLYPNWDRGLEHELRDQFELASGARIGALSRGSRMRLALAAALPYRPSLLLLDEPFSGLDSLAREAMVVELLKAAEGAAMIIASHDLVELEGFTTDVAYLDRGRLILQQPTEMLVARFRQVSITLQQPALMPLELPPHWLEAAMVGRLLTFTDIAFTDEPALAQAVAARVGSVTALEAQTMSLVKIARSLMIASREGVEP